MEGARQEFRDLSTPEFLPREMPDSKIREEASIEKAVQTRPVSFDVEQARHDLEHNTSSKGWPAYWVERLKPESDTLPPDLRLFVTGELPLKPKQRQMLSEKFAHFVRSRINETRNDLQRAEIQAQQQAERDELDEVGVEAMLGQAPLSVESEKQRRKRQEYERDRADFDHRLKKGWLEYWLPRLKSEMETLPPEIRDAVAQGQDSKELQAYVTERREALAYKLSKRDRMNSLHEELKKIDSGKDVEPGEVRRRRELGFDIETGQMFVEGRDGKRQVVTEGDVVADLLWGIKYRPTDDFPDRKWRRIRKLSAVKEARADIQDAWNHELAFFEGVMLPTSSFTPEYLEEHPQSGAIAERMAQSLLARLEYDNPELGLKLEQSNALEDTVLKYDFKVRVINYRRGVALRDEAGSREEHVAAKREDMERFDSERRRLGVQFTINTDRDVIGKKHGQIRQARKKIGRPNFEGKVDGKVDDIVLVVVRMLSIQRAFRQWLQKGKPSGGPEQYLDDRERHDLIKSITRDIPSAQQATVDAVDSRYRR